MKMFECLPFVKGGIPGPSGIPAAKLKPIEGLHVETSEPLNITVTSLTFIHWCANRTGPVTSSVALSNSSCKDRKKKMFEEVND